MNIRTLPFTGSSVPIYPNNFASPPAGGQSSLPTILVFQPEFQNPQVHQANVGVERALGRNFAVAATLLYVRGRDLQRSIDINVGGASTATIQADGQSVAYMRFNPAAKPFSNFARVIQFQDTAKSNYKGLTVEIKKRYSHRFEGNVSYTLGKVMDDVPDSTAVAPGSFDDAKMASNPADTQADYTVGNNDQRHRLVVSGMLSIPIPSGVSDRVVRALLGGFSVSGILTAQTGLPYSAALGATDLNLDGNNRSDVAPGFRRNSFRLPSTWTSDLRLTREIPMAGRARVLLMAEAFNTTNRGNVIAERNTYYALRSGALAQLSDFGSILGSGDPRIVQLAAKLVW